MPSPIQSPPTFTVLLLFGWCLSTGAIAGCAPDWEEGCVLPVCDVRQAACQSAVYQHLGCSRGTSSAAPPVAVVTPEEALETLSEDAYSAEERESYRAQLRGMALFGMADADHTLDTAREALADDVVGFYSDDSVTVIDRGEPLDTLDATGVLLHEFVHAVQDAEFDLSALHEEHAGTRDEYLALRALTEGEAKHYELWGRASHEGIYADWDRTYEDWRKKARAEAIEHDSPWVFAVHHFAYAYGASFVFDAWATDRQSAVDELYLQIPSSTAEIIAGYGNETSWTGVVAPLVPVAPAGFEYLGASSPGLWLVGVLAAKLGGNLWYHDPTGARFFLFRSQEGDEVLAMWRIRLDSAENALIVGARVSQSAAAAPGVRLTAWGYERDVILLATDDEELVLDGAQTIEWVPADGE